MCIKKKQTWLDKTKKASNFNCVPLPTKAPRPPRPPTGGQGQPVSDDPTCNHEDVEANFMKFLKKSFPASTYIFSEKNFRFKGKSGNGNYKALFMCGKKPNPKVMLKCKKHPKTGRDKWQAVIKFDPAQPQC